MGSGIGMLYRWARVVAALFVIHAVVANTVPEAAHAATASEILASYPFGGPDMVTAIKAEVATHAGAANDFLAAIYLGVTPESQIAAIVAAIYESVEVYSIAGNPSQGLILQNQVENWIAYYSSPTTGDPDAIGRILAGAQELTDGYSNGRIGTVVADSGNTQLQQSFEGSGGQLASSSDGGTQASGGTPGGGDGDDPIAGDPGCGDPPC